MASVKEKESVCVRKFLKSVQSMLRLLETDILDLRFLRGLKPRREQRTVSPSELHQMPSVLSFTSGYSTKVTFHNQARERRP